jgi:hypothetical protein
MKAMRTMTATCKPELRAMADHADLGAADDVQRYLLCCVLRDAREWHYAILDSCAACLAAGGACIAHWDEHEEPCQEYRDLSSHLEGYEGTARGTACPLDRRQRQAIAAALPKAIAYRSNMPGPADIAIVAAYSELESAWRPPTGAV